MKTTNVIILIVFLLCNINIALSQNLSNSEIDSSPNTNKKFTNITELCIMISDFSGRTAYTSASIGTVVGHLSEPNRSSFGLGVAVELRTFPDEIILIPIFIDSRINFTKGKGYYNTFFWFVDGGYSLVIGNEWRVADKGGLMISSGVGLRFKTINISFGYMLQQLKYKDYYCDDIFLLKMGVSIY